MKNKTRFQQAAALLLLGVLGPAVAGGAVATITARELQEARETRQVTLVIDIRPVAEYDQGHVPGAINIPYFAIDGKSLPPAGAVVAYGNGLGHIDEAAAAAALNAKPGIEARLLAGGLAAWESAGLPTTHPKGFTEAHVPFITYNQLEDARALGLVLADLRRPAEPIAFGATGSGASSPPPPTDLRETFPQARVVGPESGLAHQQTASGGHRSMEASVMRQLADVDAGRELIVLIDDGDGSAERTALKLRSSGNKRVVVLAGGETILQRSGRAGSQRVGYGLAEGETDERSEETAVANEPTKGGASR